MNLKTYDQSTQLLTLANFAAHGQVATDKNTVLPIGVIDCVQNGSEQILQTLCQGIREKKALPLTYQIANFTYFERLSPAQAKYAHPYTEFVARSTMALVRAHALEGVVAIIDNYVTGLGVLIGCTRCNCPVILMPVGFNNASDQIITLAAAKANRTVTAEQMHVLTNTYQYQAGTYPHDTLTQDFYKLATVFDFMPAESTTLLANSAQVLEVAGNVAKTIQQRADDIITTKRLINSKTAREAFDKYRTNGGSVSGILLCSPLFKELDIKIPDLFTSLRTSLGDRAYVVATDKAPEQLAGTAWCYRNLGDALTALLGGAIDAGVMVLQGFTDGEVSLVAYTIQALHKQDVIALLTDGYCATTDVLTVANIAPDGDANQEFANIQNGDTLEIDTTKGRITTSATAKDVKLRAKYNTVTKNDSPF